MLSLSPYQAWSMWAVATLFYAYQYVLRVLPNVIREELLVHFNTNALEFGQFAGLYYLSYSLMHIPLAIWLDRKNPKYIIPLCILATVGGIVPLLISDTIAAANIGRFIMGIGSSGAILGVFKVIRLGFPESHFNRMLGLSVTVGLVGALYGGLPVRTLLETTHWQDIVLYFCWIGGFLAVLAFVIIPSKYKPIISTHNVIDEIIQVLKNKNVLMVCICAGLMLGPLEGFADVWGAGFLQSVYQIAPAKAAGISSLMFLGMLFGAPGLTYMADYFKAHIKIIIGAALFMGTVFVTMLYGFGSPEMLSVLFTAVGVACAYQIIAIYVASTYVRERHVSITTALANMIIMTFGYFFHTVIGIMMGDHQSGGNFSHEQYQYGLSIIPICLFIAAIGFMIQLKRNKA
jgi:MFS family permease